MAAAVLQSPLQLDRATIEPVVRQTLDSLRIPGAVVAIAHGDSVVLLEAFGVRDVESGAPMRSDDRFLIGSLTKQFTATLLAQLAASGTLALDDPLAMHLDPAYPHPEWAQRVTLRQLATHTAGLPRNPVNRRDVPDSPGVMLPYSRTELYEGFTRTTLEAEPGSVRAYSNLGFAILGEVVARAAGSRYEVVLGDSLLVPLGLEDTAIADARADESRFPSGYWPRDERAIARPRWVFGEVTAFGGLYSTARDLARFLVAQTASGPGAPFPAGTRAVLHTPSPGVAATPGQAMALGWFVYSLPGGVTLVGGGGEVDSFSSAMGFVEAPRVAIVALTNRGGGSGEQVIRAVVQAVQPLLTSGAR
jgi:CubicO group peptidase (beta-lactamase class C family)